MLTSSDGIFAQIDDTLGTYYNADTKSGILLQQDGAKPHICKAAVSAVTAAGHISGRWIDVTTQPPKSPELNLLDLAFNYSLQKIAKRIKYSVTSKEEFIQIVSDAFHDYPVDKLIRINALQLVAYREILRAMGGNQYNMPHTGIRKRQHLNFQLRGDLYEDCADYSISAEVVRAAADYYEHESGHPFPWNQNPNYVFPTDSPAASAQTGFVTGDLVDQFANDIDEDDDGLSDYDSDDSNDDAF
jgi:hypothetical protein